MNIALASGTEFYLQLFIIIACLLIVPVAVGIMVVLFKLAFLIHSASEFLTLASYELSPLIRELRLMVDHLQDIGQRASSGVQDLGNSLQGAKPIVRKGFNQIQLGASALLSGLGRSFQRSVKRNP